MYYNTFCIFMSVVRIMEDSKIPHGSFSIKIQTGHFQFSSICILGMSFFECLFMR